MKEALLPLTYTFYAEISLNNLSRVDISDHKKLFLDLQMSSVLRKWVNSTN